MDLEKHISLCEKLLGHGISMPHSSDFMSFYKDSKKAYLYRKLRNGTIRRYFGRAEIKRDNLKYGVDRADFIPTLSDQKLYVISAFPNIVFNNSVWFEEKNDALAKQILS